MDSKKSPDKKEADNLYTSLKGALFGGFLIWASSWILVVFLNGQPEGPGEFGDMFGAVNALFSAFAFAGIIITIALQSKELRLQRQELTQSREAQQQSAKALTDQLLIQSYTAQLTALNSVIENKKAECRMMKNEIKMMGHSETAITRTKELREDIVKAEESISTYTMRQEQILNTLQQLQNPTHPHFTPLNISS